MGRPPIDAGPEGEEWAHWPGQLGLHPEVMILKNGTAISPIVAARWCLVPVTLNGRPWWYGWAPVQLKVGTVRYGWWVLPRGREDVSDFPFGGCDG